MRQETGGRRVQLRWISAGGAFALATVFALVCAVLETALFDAPNDGLTPGLRDYLYAAHMHGVIALLAAFAALVVAWIRRTEVNARIALGVLLALEFGIVGAYWAGTAGAVPRFHTTAGKLTTAGLVLAGTLLGIALALILARRLRLRGAIAGRSIGTLGSCLAVALLGVTVVALIAARPHGDCPSIRPAADSARPRENVILLLSDTLRRDHLSYFGYERPTSPAIDGLLRESYVFTNASTPSTWTIPSVTSLFTGRYPSTHGITSALQRLPGEFTTLAEHFRAHGYRTAAFIGNPILTGRNGFAQGFDAYFPPDPPAWTYHNRTAVERIATQLRRPGTQGMAWKLSAEARAWMRRHPDNPFFVYIHFMEPHSPYTPSVEDRRAVAPDAPPGPSEPPRLFDELASVAGDCRDWECLDEPVQLSASDREGMIANYDGLIHGLDRMIAEFLQDLNSMGLLDRTHVIFCNDHGEEFGDHRGWFHGNSIYEEMTACPLAYRPPGGLRTAREIARPVSLLDIVPTLCERLGIAAPADHQGRAIDEVFDRPPVPRPVLSESPPHLYALRYGPYKSIRRGAVADPQWRLFDLMSDPRELRDLASAQPDTLAALRGITEGWVSALAQQAGRPAEAATDPELLQRLKTLGYVR